MRILRGDNGHQCLLTIVRRPGVNSGVATHRGILAVGTHQQFRAQQSSVLQLDLLPPDLPGQIKSLQDYDFTSKQAQQDGCDLCHTGQ